MPGALGGYIESEGNRCGVVVRRSGPKVERDFIGIG